MLTCVEFTYTGLKKKILKAKKICTIILGNKVLYVLYAQTFLILKNLRLCLIEKNEKG